MILSAASSIESDSPLLVYISEIPTLARLFLFLLFQVSLGYSFGFLFNESTKPYRMSIRYAFFFIISITSAWITGFNIQHILFPETGEGFNASLSIVLATGGALVISGLAAYKFVKQQPDKDEEALTILIILFLSYGIVLSALMG